MCRLRVSGSWARTRHRSATTSIIFGAPTPSEPLLKVPEVPIGHRLVQQGPHPPRPHTAGAVPGVPGNFRGQGRGSPWPPTADPGGHRRPLSPRKTRELAERLVGEACQPLPPGHPRGTRPPSRSWPVSPVTARFGSFLRISVHFGAIRLNPCSPTRKVAFVHLPPWKGLSGLLRRGGRGGQGGIAPSPTPGLLGALGRAVGPSGVRCGLTENLMERCGGERRCGTKSPGLFRGTVEVQVSAGFLAEDSARSF